MKLMAINEQMEMAFMDEKVDPVSGNEVPPGSLPEEVRDDIDARLSEGEYVVPADVVRFFGVKFFEDLRTQAKTGLASMDAAGRIGGDPVDVPVVEEGTDVSEQDLAMLEKALATSGLKDGGLVNKTLNSIASQGQTDPLVNSRMNAKGMTIGLYAGGMTESLYNDTTKIDTVIDKVLAATKTNPSLLEELSKRGVTINTTKANMKSDDMQKANRQTSTLAEGGLLPEGAENTSSSFNPFEYGLGFSSFGTTNNTGGRATIMVDYYNPSTGEIMKIEHDAVTNLPIGTVPAGFIMGVPPAIEAPTGRVNREDDFEVDMDAWKNKYTYSDPDALAGETLGAINKEQSGISKFFKNSPVNQFLQATAIGELKSNIDYLEARGYNADKIAEMKAALAVRTENRLGDVTKLGSIINYALTNTSNLTNKILDEYGSDPFEKTTTTTTTDVGDRTGAVTYEAPTVSQMKKTQREDKSSEREEARNRADKIAKEKDAMGSSATVQDVVKARAKTDEGKAAAAKKKADDDAASKAGVTGGSSGGMYKGGLMQKKNKKKKKKKK
tara:strand:+ start:2512 stop:4176 length:1665 start_codon:yes stop_codon:yes gene_type:complete